MKFLWLNDALSLRGENKDERDALKILYEWGLPPSARNARREAVREIIVLNLIQVEHGIPRGPIM